MRVMKVIERMLYWATDGFLDLSELELTDDDLRSVSVVSNITGLDLSGNPLVTNEGLARLIILPRLDQLSLREMQIDDDGLAVLASFPRLRTLGVGGARVTDRGLAHLAGVVTLRVLNIGAGTWTPEGLAALARLRPDLDIQIC